MNFHYRRLLLKIIRVSWFIFYTIPTVLLVMWLAETLPHLDIYVDRQSLPHGVLLGIVWAGANAIILFLALLPAMFTLIFVNLIVGKLEDLLLSRFIPRKIIRFFDSPPLLCSKKPPSPEEGGRE